MIGTIAIGLGAVVAGVLGYAASRPSAFSISRSTRINAAPDKIFPHINDFHKWEAWSPWAKLDPTMRTSFTGQPAGRGASYDWEGNNKVGKGRMEILESTPPSRVAIQLDFEKPWKSSNHTVFSLTPQGADSTDVTWTMSGNNAYMAKVFGVFMNMDKLVGRDFERGLANLKSIAESRAV